LGWRDRALISVLFGGGGRITETVTLTIEQVNLSKREARVIGKGNKERIIVLSPTAVKDLTVYLSQHRPKLVKKCDTNRIFLNEHGMPFTRFGAAQMLSKRFTTTHVHCHNLRHSFGAAMVQSGADIRTVAEAMGHASVVTTQRYMQVSVQRIHEMVETALE
jgi:site-specific recombinase XerD